MDQENREESQFDHYSARFVTGFAQRTPRRGFLARCGKLALVALGVGTVELLPSDRIVPKVAAANCNDWYLCGIWGRTCDCCAGDVFHCPNGTSQYNNWQSCCQSHTIYYSDCCFSTANCDSCTWCTNNPVEQPLWCGPGGSGDYRCTAIVIGDRC